MKSSACSVYRYFTKQGRLLYVGCTKNFPLRDRAHRYLKDWYPKAHYVVLTNFGEIGLGQHYERAIVTAERPIHNVHLRQRPEKVDGFLRNLERMADGSYHQKPIERKCISS